MTHLNDEQIASYLAAEEQADVREHMEACADCRNDVARLANIVGSARSATMTINSVDAAFWTRQRAAIVAASVSSHRRPRAWAVALVFTVLVLLASALVRVDRVRPVPAKRANAGISDDALLAEVRAALQEQVPVAFKPAQLLVTAREQAENRPPDDSAVSRRQQQ